MSYFVTVEYEIRVDIQNTHVLLDVPKKKIDTFSSARMRYNELHHP